MLRRYLVDPVEMWWPANLAQVSLFRYGFFIFVQISLQIVHIHLFVWFEISKANSDLVCFVSPVLELFMRRKTNQKE